MTTPEEHLARGYDLQARAEGHWADGRHEDARTAAALGSLAFVAYGVTNGARLLNQHLAGEQPLPAPATRTPNVPDETLTGQLLNAAYHGLLRHDPSNGYSYAYLDGIRNVDVSEQVAVMEKAGMIQLHGELWRLTGQGAAIFVDCGIGAAAGC